MKSITAAVLTVFLATALMGCNADHKDVVKTEVQGQKDIRDAQIAAEQKKADAEKEIGMARARGDLIEEENAKVKATKEIAKAEEKVDSTKAEATEDLMDAKRKAGETTGSYEKK